MAFSAEAKVKLGIDTADFEYGLAQTATKLNAAGRKMQDVMDAQGSSQSGGASAAGGLLGKAESVISKKFGAGGLIKGLLHGTGIASGMSLVEGAINAIRRPFKVGAEGAKNMADATGELREIQNKEISTLGGYSASLRVMSREHKIAGDELKKAKDTESKLRNDPFTWLTDSGEEKLLEANKLVADLVVKQAKLGSEMNIQRVIMNRRLEAMDRERKVARELRADELSHTSEVAVIDTKIAGIYAEKNALRKEGAAPDVLRKLDDEIAALRHQQRVIEKTTSEKVAGVERASKAADDMHAAEMRNAGDLEKAAVQLIALQAEYVALKKQGATADVLAENAQKQHGISIAYEIKQKLIAEGVEDTIRQIELDDKLTKIELRNGSDREKLQAKLNSLKKEYSVLVKRGETADKLEANKAKQNELRNEGKKLNKVAGEKISATYITLGQSAAGSRNPKRGRTESERIADRGAKYLEASENAIRRGDKIGAANNAARAKRDFLISGKKQADAMSLISKDPSNSIRSDLLSASESLKNAAQNLTPTPVNK